MSAQPPARPRGFHPFFSPLAHQPRPRQHRLPRRLSSVFTRPTIRRLFSDVRMQPAGGSSSPTSPPRAPTPPTWTATASGRPLPPALNKWSPLCLLLSVALGVVTFGNIIVTVGLGSHLLFNLEQSCTKADSQNLRDELQKTKIFLQEWKTTLLGQKNFCMPKWLLDYGKCYYFSERRNNWEESREFCNTQEAQLLLIKDNRTLNFIRENSKEAGYFVGLKKEHSVWKWIDGTILDECPAI
uniref:Killer cell lectin-like receptor subfamily B member 1 isoform X2 n=1 Tax=Geotrypetes seraphini TaxID=260995 RepID=A0A6P8Q8E6_GEOSA|nr:killer cell lectin-like receptor subfamily B member 1 isoform X2 [Geotrypetes seraphini]